MYFGSNRNVVINVQPIIPSTPIISIAGDNLHSDALNGNQWYNMDGLIAGETNQDFTPKSSGEYYVIVSANGCSSNSSNSINFIPSGIVLNKFARSIKVYPDPVTDELIIEFKGNTNKTNFEVINASGQMVYTGNLLEKEVVKTSHFIPGVYLVKLKSGDTFEFKKVIKN